MPKRIDRTGERFGRLIVLRFGGSYYRPDGRLYGIKWACRCDCGAELTVHAYGLKSGATQSCGCLQKEEIQKQGWKNKRHGLTESKTYLSWISMRKRCEYKKGNRWKLYGGRGVKVCRRWLKFENFLEDMGERPAGLTLERKDNNGDYCQKNCMWASQKEQQNNRRNNRRLEVGGVTLTLAQWSAKTGISGSVITSRISRGWTIEQAVTQRPRAGNYKRRNESSN